MNCTKQQSEIMSRFTFHKPDDEGKSKMKAIRIAVRQLALTIGDLCPESREKATALTNLAIVMMHANSAIVQTYPIDEADLASWELGTKSEQILADLPAVGTTEPVEVLEPAATQPTSSEVAQAVSEHAEAHTEGKLE